MWRLKMKKSKNRKNKAWSIGNPTPGNDPINKGFDRLLDQAESTGALGDEEVQRLFFSLKMNPDDKHILALLEDAMHPFIITDKMNPNPFRPLPDSSSGLDVGDVKVGTINETSLDWAFQSDRFPHEVIIGPTGKGKSYAIYGQLEGIHGRVPYILVTVKNETSRFLVDPPIADKVIRFEELRISLFTPPPGVNETQWQQAVVELFCSIWLLKYARSPLHESVDELRDEFVKLSQASGIKHTFTLSNLYARVKGKRSKYSEGAATVLDMIIRATGDVFECSIGWPVENLLFSGSTVILIPDVADDQVARFFVDWLMEYAYAYFRANGPDDGSLQLVFAIDDAHRFLSARTEKDAMTTLSHKYLIVRQSGISIVAVSQCPEDLSSTVISQSSIVMQVGSLIHEAQVRTMGRAFGLHSRDWDALKTVGQGEFVALENMGRYSGAFAGRVKRFPGPSIPFTEQDRIRLMSPVIGAFPWKPTVHHTAPKPQSSSSAQPPQLSNEALALAIDILANLWSFMNERYQRLGLTGGSANKVKRELIDRGWVREFSIPRHGGNPILLEPLPPLATGLHRSLPSYGKGGFLHAFMQHRIADELKRQGYTSIELEKFYGAKGVDLVGIAPNGDLVGFEVTVSKGNVVDNFVKDFIAQPRFVLITSVCLSSKDVKQVTYTLFSDPRLTPFHGRMNVLPIAHWL
jgi:hypothetical protein